MIDSVREAIHLHDVARVGRCAGCGADCGECHAGGKPNHGQVGGQLVSSGLQRRVARGNARFDWIAGEIQ